MEIWQLALYGAVAFVMSIISGIAGSGAGFVLTPLLIFLGLTPAQTVATSKFSGLAASVGSLSGMYDAKTRISKWRITYIMLLSFGVGLIVPHIITALDQGIYRMLLGIFLLLMIPVVILKKFGLRAHRPKLWQKYTGSVLVTLALLLQGAFSGGLGSLVNLVMMGMLGMTASEANIAKRWSQLILNLTILAGLVGSGLVVWQVAGVGAAMTLSGSYIGGRMAAHRGNDFIMHAMIILMLLGGIFLIFGA